MRAGRFPGAQALAQRASRQPPCQHARFSGATALAKGGKKERFR
jgi:hypothetical protein